MKIWCLFFVVIGHLHLLNASSSCTTPNSEKAKCVSILECGILQQALSSGDATAKEFVKASKCEDDFMVCCGTMGNFHANLVTKAPELSVNRNNIQSLAKTKEGRREYILRNVLPTLAYCGYQHSDDYVIENKENHTSIYEFPWVVHIDYPGHYTYHRPTPGTEFKCVGVLISSRIVLTSLKCGSYQRVTVKMGQYHKRNATSCTNSTQYGEECTDSVIKVDGVIIGIPNSDLVLIILPNDVTYSEYVRPICWPFEESHRAKAGDTVYTSGWGERDIKGSKVTLKKRISHEVSSTEDFQLRKKSNNASNICEGDQGGPVMYVTRRKQWFLNGVIDTTPCNSTQPILATRLTSEIFENMVDPIFNCYSHPEVLLLLLKTAF